MTKLRFQFVGLCLILAVFNVHEACASDSTRAGITFTGENRNVRMYMVRRLYDFDQDIPSIRAANEEAHQAHLLRYGQTIVSSALISDDGTRIGSVSISDIHSREVINRYVYDDPFTRGKIYKSITIEPVDLYKVDGAYNRAPAWFAGELQRRQRELGFDVPVKPTGIEPQTSMFLVRRVDSDPDTVERIRIEQDAAHNEHLKAYGRTVVSGALVASDERTGGVSISDYATWNDIGRYVYEDPFTRAGMFREITIERVDLYKLDGSYERAPAWFYEQMKNRQVDD